MTKKRVAAILAGIGAAVATGAAIAVVVRAKKRKECDMDEMWHDDDYEYDGCTESDFENDAEVWEDDEFESADKDSDGDAILCSEKIASLKDEIKALKDALRKERGRNERLLCEINTIIPLEKKATVDSTTDTEGEKDTIAGEDDPDVAADMANDDAEDIEPLVD